MAATIAADRAAYERDGFVLHPAPLLSPAVIAAAVDGMDRVRRGDYDTGVAPDGGTPPGADPNKLCKIENPQLGSRALQAAIASPRLGELAAAVTGAHLVQVWWVQLLLKPPTQPGTPTNIGWHQDMSYWRDWHDDSVLFTIWLALSDVTPATGPMRFAVGSHHWGFAEGASDFFGQGDPDLQRDRIPRPASATWTEVPALLGPGGASVHHKLTWHGSSANLSTAPRRSLAIHLRTERSALTNKPTMWVNKHLHEPAICPVIFGAR